MSEKAQF